MEEGTDSIVICKTCSMYNLIPIDLKNYKCTKCKLIKLLEEKVELLEKNLNTLKLNQQNEKPQIPQKEHTQIEYKNDQATPNRADPLEEENRWTHVTHRKKHKPNTKPLSIPTNPDPNPLAITNRYHGLPIEENIQAAEKEAPERIPNKPAPPNAIMAKKETPQTTPDKKKRRVLVIGDSILKGTEPAICRPDNQSREVCCLPGAKIMDVAEKLTKIIKPTDYYPLLVLHVGTNDTKKDLKTIMRDYEQLGKKVKDINAQVVFSSILPTRGQHPVREQRILQANHWLKGWCRQKNFGFLDHGLYYLQDGLLARDGLHLTKTGKNVLGKRLAQLVRRALN